MKTTMCKRLCALMLVMVMILSGMPIRAFAQEVDMDAQDEQKTQEMANQAPNNSKSDYTSNLELSDYTPVDWDRIWESLEKQNPVDMDNPPLQEAGVIPDEDMIMDAIVDETPKIYSEEQPELNKPSDENFGDRCGNILIGWAANKAMDWAFAKIMNSIFKDTTPTMEDIFSKQNEMNNKLDFILQQIKISDYKEDMRLKQIALNSIYLVSKRSVEILEKNQESKVRIANMKPLYNGSGKDYCSDVINFANTYLTKRAAKMPNGSIFNVYDLYSKNYFPWENQGYGFRQNMRNLDYAEFYQSAAIALIACKAHIDSSSELKAGAEATYSQLQETIKEVLENNTKTVVKHLPANETLFQVPGKERHFIWNMNKDLYCDGGYSDWSKVADGNLEGIKGKEGRWVLSDMTINSGSLGNNKYHAPEARDYQLMISYYKTAGSGKNLGQIIADSGKMPVSNTMYSTNHVSWGNARIGTNDYRFYCGGISASSQDGKDNGFYLGKYWLNKHDEAGVIKGWGEGNCYPNDVNLARMFLVR